MVREEEVKSLLLFALIDLGLKSVAFELSDPFPSLTEAQVLTEYAKLQMEMASGKVIIGAGSGDVNKQNLVQKSQMEREAMFRASLFTKNPTVYPQYGETEQNLAYVAFS